MTINYVGTRANNEIGGYCRDKRYAEFSYTEKEEIRFGKIVEYLEEQGFTVDTGVEGWAVIEVADKDEYNDVVRYYKEAKKIFK